MNTEINAPTTRVLRIPTRAPLSPVDYYTLAALAIKDMHAYLLCQKITRDSDGVVQISLSGMTKLLQRLTEEQFIAPLDYAPRPQVYKLTDFGRKRLEQEIRQHQRAVIVGQTALALYDL